MNAAKDFARMYMGMDAQLTTLGSVAVGRGPIGDIVTDTAGGGALVVTNYGHDSISFLDASQLVVEATVGVGGEPLSATVADDRVYVATTSASYDAVSVVDVDARAVTASYALDLGITDIAVSPDRKHVYVSRTGQGRADIAVIDVAADELNTIQIAAGPGVGAEVVRVSPDGQRLFAAVRDGRRDRLVTVDVEAARVVGVVPIDSPIRDIAVSPDGTFAYVLTADPRRGGLFVAVDTAEQFVTETAEIGGWPTQMVLGPDGTRAHIANRDHVAVLCALTHELIETVTVAGLPSCVATSPDGSRLYVADYDGVVTAMSAGPAVTLPTVQVMAIDVMSTPDVRELEPAAV
jgi:YVTN family beta-propeller protein